MSQLIKFKKVDTEVINKDKTLLMKIIIFILKNNITHKLMLVSFKSVSL